MRVNSNISNWSIDTFTKSIPPCCYSYVLYLHAARHIKQGFLRCFLSGSARDKIVLSPTSVLINLVFSLKEKLDIYAPHYHAVNSDPLTGNTQDSFSRCWSVCLTTFQRIKESIREIRRKQNFRGDESSCVRASKRFAENAYRIAVHCWSLSNGFQGWSCLARLASDNNQT